MEVFELQGGQDGFIEFLYSIKTNAFPPMIQEVSKEGFGADAASSGEVKLAAENGIRPEKIFYSSPGKTDRDIEECYGKCTIIADSISEIGRINETAVKNGDIVKIGVRLNPDFSMLGENGCSSKFGIDAEQLLKAEKTLAEYANVQIVGIHIHIQSQILDYQILGRYYQNCFALAKKFMQWSMSVWNLLTLEVVLAHYTGRGRINRWIWKSLLI